MWTGISTETAQFMFDSLADFQYRVCAGEGASYMAQCYASDLSSGLRFYIETE